MIFLTGSGSFRTRVGSARIWSPLASCGFLQQIDDFDAILAREMFLADALQIGERL